VNNPVESGPEIWINLQLAYDLHKAGEADLTITQQAAVRRVGMIVDGGSRAIT